MLVFQHNFTCVYLEVSSIEFNMPGFHLSMYGIYHHRAQSYGLIVLVELVFPSATSFTAAAKGTLAAHDSQNLSTPARGTHWACQGREDIMG